LGGRWGAWLALALGALACAHPGTTGGPSRTRACPGTPAALSLLEPGGPDLPPVRTVRLDAGVPRRPFARFGQCQYRFDLEMDLSTGLHAVPQAFEGKVRRCFETAVRERVQVLVLPELALAFEDNVRERLTGEARRLAAGHGMIIVAGTFYDRERRNRLAVISKDGLVLGEKLRPSLFEASPRAGLGMTPGESLLLLETPYGRLAPVVCVDFISDAVQYTLRNLATRGQVDAVLNVNYNPAAWEFLVEANSLARRHPVFVSITNVAGDAGRCSREGLRREAGECYGYSALFGSVRADGKDFPNCFQAVRDLVGEPFKDPGDGRRSVPYDSLLANLSGGEEAMLVYELNLRLAAEPANPNAPDQGYPTVRELRVVPLE
jgi:predicted amidohydrolase